MSTYFYHICESKNKSSTCILHIIYVNHEKETVSRSTFNLIKVSVGFIIETEAFSITQNVHFSKPGLGAGVISFVAKPHASKQMYWEHVFKAKRRFIQQRSQIVRRDVIPGMCTYGVLELLVLRRHRPWTWSEDLLGSFHICDLLRVNYCVNFSCKCKRIGTQPLFSPCKIYHINKCESSPPSTV